MCGILGYTGRGSADRHKLELLFAFNESRGGDACGMAKVGREANVEIYKKAVSAGSFISSKQWRAFFDDDIGTFIGHTRNGTIGFNTDANAHPFNFPSIVGVHNGSIPNYLQIAHQEKRQFQVDSQAILYLIDKYGARAGIKKATGKAALAWIDKHSLSMSLYRDGNPLFAGGGDDGIYFSSIKEALIAIGCNKIEEVTAYKVFTYSQEEGKFLSKETDGTVYMMNEVKPVAINKKSYSYEYIAKASLEDYVAMKPSDLEKAMKIFVKNMHSLATQNLYYSESIRELDSILANYAQNSPVQVN